MKSISSSVIRRLPIYYRFLSELDKKGIQHVSSRELAKRMCSTASQVRQDFNCFGEFGQQGIGYNVKKLKDEIENILGIRCHYPAILIGAGNIGTAIANKLVFENKCFDLVGVFDKDEAKIGRKIGELDILHTDDIESFCSVNAIVTAILCVPKSEVEELSERLYNIGIRSFWNFSHFDLNVKFENVIVENVHLSDSLMQLCFRITHKSNDL